MIMTEVVLPDMVSTAEDHMLPYPRAPPPSPEMQPRGHGKVFEFPTTKFERIGLDLRRDDMFQEEDDENGYLLCSDGVEGAIHEDEFLSYSPRKRVCCAPSTNSIATATTNFSSLSDSYSLTSSGFGSFRDYNQREEEGKLALGGRTQVAMELTNGIVGGSRYSGPSLYSTLTQTTSPLHLFPPRIDEVEMQHGGKCDSSFLPTSRPSPFGDSCDGCYDDSSQLFSRSYDLHHVHPHLPQSFETTELPEVRPGRSRTLGSASPLHDAILSSLYPSASQTEIYNGDAGTRKRKVSIKRKTLEVKDESSLQFCFDYSYSSTGSSGENDWVVVDCQADSWPQEKKACCIDPSILTQSASIGGGGGGAMEVLPGVGVGSSFANSLVMGNVQPGGDGVSRETTPTHSRAVMETSTAMDWKHLESDENMETDANEATPPLVLRPHLQDNSVNHTHYFQSPLRHSCVESSTNQMQRLAPGDWGVNQLLTSDADLDSKLSLSKSL